MHSLARLIQNLRIQNARPYILERKIHVTSTIWTVVMDPAKLLNKKKKKKKKTGVLTENKELH